MSLFIQKKARDKDASPPPQKGAARFFFLLTTHASKLFFVNLLFLLFSMPVVTAPAALSGLHRVCGLLVRGGVAEVWSDFITEFKSSFFKSIVVFIGCIVLVPAAWLGVYIGRNAASGATAFILFTLAALALFWSLLMTCYAYPMMALLRLRATDILRNAVSLIFLEFKKDLWLMLFVGGGTVLFSLLLPYSLPLILCLFSLLSLVSNVIVAEPISQRVIPREQNAAQ